MTPGATGRSVGATQFNPKAFDLYFPIEIAPGSGPHCGFPDGKLSGRLDPVVETSPGVWTFNGCIASTGNIFYSVNIVIAFPDGQTLAFSVLDQTERDREAHFAFEVRRVSVAGAKATVYCNHTRP